MTSQQAQNTLSCDRCEGGKWNDDTSSDQDWQHFIAGAGASAINIFVTFPIFKVCFRQQVEGTRLRVAFAQIRNEGFHFLYRGVLPPLLQKATSVSLMFGLYHKFQRDLNSTFPSVPSQINNGAAAIFAGTAEAILTPFERVQTILSHRKHNEKYLNTFHIFWELRRFGIKEYYRGLTAVLLRNGPTNAIFFGFRGYIKNALPEAQTSVQNTLQDFVCGALLGATNGTIFYPLSVVKTNMQKHVGGVYWSVFKTFYNIFKERNYRVMLLYRGAFLNFSRAIVSWGVINASFEIILSELHNMTNKS
ncbi:mitochondrial nicotinamide adenine dinucleotide transporter SLC25A51-like [Xenia sp. Carnegie-2017]|uniref:mitochondrial nicotinamide adenine dinucleotide transporter SLC25A51-like n=1 Tax=Xenia sp. Carnegie-2017 TaxID=2897299 RepID=UPI001F03C4EA|nr:mitochondrial nicotinamide adenine dinucleotide transporter SLC25A51-like [Xenia sp. Carnegie-2017]